MPSGIYYFYVGMCSKWTSVCVVARAAVPQCECVALCMSPGNPIGHKRNPGPGELLSADFGGRRDSSLRFSPGCLKITMPDFQAATSIDLCLTYFRFFTFFIWQLCKTLFFCHLLMLINASCVTDGLIDWREGEVDGWMGVAQRCVAFSFVKDAIYICDC